MKDTPLPKRHFKDGKKKFIGFRLPEALAKELNKMADELGWTTTDVVQTALDQYVYNLKIKAKPRG